MTFGKACVELRTREPGGYQKPDEAIFTSGKCALIERVIGLSKYTTKIAIAYAFRDLLSEKPINKITINDISERCNINRQTFYYHFHDIIDLTEWMCEISSEKALKENKTYDTWQEGFLAIFRIIKKDKQFVNNIFRYAPKEYVYNYLYRVTHSLLYDVLSEKAKGMTVREEDKNFIVDFYKYSFVGVVTHWIENDMREEPEQIVERVNSLVQGSFEHALQNMRRDQ